MATFTAVNNGNGTVTLLVNGAVVNCTQIRIGFGTFPYTNSFSYTDTGAVPGTNSYTCTFLTSSGATISSLNASTTATWPSPSVSVSTGGPNASCSWSVGDDGNTSTTFTGVQVFYSINGGTLTYLGLYGGLSGTSGSVFAGYSSSITFQAQPTWHFTTTGADVETANSASGTTGPAPPSPPNPPSALVGTDHTTSVDLAWTASAGGANGYEISRNGTIIQNAAATTYTDSSPGATRPVNYSVRAYNSNASGTAYSTAISVTVGGVDSAGILIC